MKKLLLFSKKLCLILSLLLVWQVTYSQTALLDPLSQPKFQKELPRPAVLTPDKFGRYEVIISQFQQDLGLVINKKPVKTTVWGYNKSYPGPTIEATEGTPIQVRWVNNLPTGDVFQNHLFDIDPTLHWAGSYQNLSGIPTVTHLHGGHTEAASDGNPLAWYTPKFKETGKLFVKKTRDLYTYANDQEATTLWYHDHTMGITRLNVYAGLAGFYLLRNQHELDLNLPKGNYEIPLVIQDRSFDANGQLFYPSSPALLETPPTAPLPSAYTVLPEFFGEFILVNGKVWPYVEVEPTKYRLRLLNGSDSRFYELNLPGVTFKQIGSDGGFLPNPVELNKLIIGPGERLDVIVDFSGMEGKKLIMKNTARSPYPFGATANPQTSGQIMRFDVKASTTMPVTTIPMDLRNKPLPVLNASKTRQLVLFEGTDEYGRLKPQLGTAKEGPLGFMDKITENPELDAVEEWEIYNTTADAHPIHLHLVHFQVINTQKFNVKNSVFGVDQPVIELQGGTMPPAPENAGLKDTFIVYPGEVARVKALFDREGMYVWHCHILSHEDYDMMRPLYVGEIPLEYSELASTVQTAMVDAGLTLTATEGLTVAPNPFLQTTQLSFSFATDLDVTIKVYDLMGKEVVTAFSGVVMANEKYVVTFDRQNLPSGSFICKLTTSDNRSFEQVIVAQ
ncbi:multicopper oxidase domain-containing protein [Salinimicrobium soli]|uniref:multicopper oxidase domain-containing protein n=1 Tax=Salinimicrobium soli TaxID=1254399 RepID=UPI003AAB472F